MPRTLRGRARADKRKGFRGVVVGNLLPYNHGHAPCGYKGLSATCYCQKCKAPQQRGLLRVCEIAQTHSEWV